jgi:hypothetical protein
MRVRSFVGAGVALPAVGAVPRLAGRPYLPSCPRIRESSRTGLRAGCSLAAGRDAGATPRIGVRGDAVGLDSVHTTNIDQNKGPNL